MPRQYSLRFGLVIVAFICCVLSWYRYCMSIERNDNEVLNRLRSKQFNEIRNEIPLGFRFMYVHQLSLMDSCVDNSDVDALASFYDLRFVCIAHCSTRASVLNRLRTIPHLQGVRIGYCTVIQDQPFDVDYFSSSRNAFHNLNFVKEND
jgi:hypothetical protein